MDSQRPVPRRTALLAFLLAAAVLGSVRPGAPISAAEETIRLTLPEYAVSTSGGVDTVTIPGGERLAVEEGRPLVPFWIHTVDVPAGVAVRNVRMEERSGQVRAEGLRLAPITLDIERTKPPAWIGGWYPTEVFEWRVVRNADGGATLAIVVYPFYHDPDGNGSVYYREYAFVVETVPADVRILRLSTDREVCETGSAVRIDLALINDGEPLDLVVGMEIIDIAADRVIEGLPMRTLRAVRGDASFSAVWDTGARAPGDYRIRAILMDGFGTSLAEAAVDLLIRTEPDNRLTPTAPSATGSGPSQPTGGPVEGESLPDRTLLVLLGAGVVLVIGTAVFLFLRHRSAHRPDSVRRPRHRG